MPCAILLRSTSTDANTSPLCDLPDFASHCPYLYKSQSAFTGWNRLLPAPAGLNATSEVSFMKHCYPTVEQMVATIEAHLSRLPMAASPPVRTLYVLHDCQLPVLF